MSAAAAGCSNISIFLKKLRAINSKCAYFAPCKFPDDLPETLPEHLSEREILTTFGLMPHQDLYARIHNTGIRTRFNIDGFFWPDKTLVLLAFPVIMELPPHELVIDAYNTARDTLERQVAEGGGYS